MPRPTPPGWFGSTSEPCAHDGDGRAKGRFAVKGSAPSSRESILSNLCDALFFRVGGRFCSRHCGAHTAVGKCAAHVETSVTKGLIADAVDKT